MPLGFFSIRDIEEIDFPKLMRQLPASSIFDAFSTRGAYIRAILESYETLQRHEINTPQRLAHFLGQGLVETGYLAQRAENLSYRTAERLCEVFPSYFADVEQARPYVRQPERLANYVYAGRMENGPAESGDGFRYRGRGFIQLTGRRNYRIYGEASGLDLLGDPDQIARDLKKSVLVGAAFFQTNGLNEYADRDDIVAISRGVNRGDPRSRRPAHDEPKRIEWTRKALALVRNPRELMRDGVLRAGDVGEEVRALQRALTRLGYVLGAADGVFGPATRRAVLAFQDEHDLPLTGEADAATLAAIQGRLNPTVDEAPIVTEAPAPAPPAAQSQPQPSATHAPPPAAADSVETPAIDQPEPNPAEPAPVDATAPAEEPVPTEGAADAADTAQASPADGSPRAAPLPSSPAAPTQPSATTQI